MNKLLIQHSKLRKHNSSYVISSTFDELSINSIEKSKLKNTKTYFYHKDQLGSITAITDEKWRVVENYEYDVFGRVYAKRTLFGKDIFIRWCNSSEMVKDMVEHFQWTWRWFTSTVNYKTDSSWWVEYIPYVDWWKDWWEKWWWYINN